MISKIAPTSPPRDTGKRGQRHRQIAIAALGHGIAVKGRRDG
ncbi:MAG: hypothetical protein Q4G25_08780 [Paracoccus sp. (in: a-proteobacteria)]|nr:hypothetical protein [Paracoccus sp. (in: a-proteobacteria)]